MSHLVQAYRVLLSIIFIRPPLTLINLWSYHLNVQCALLIDNCTVVHKYVNKDYFLLQDIQHGEVMLDEIVNVLSESLNGVVSPVS